MQKSGHIALTRLEQVGKIGVNFEDSNEFYGSYNEDDWYLSSGSRHLSIITQNVDALHKKAGSRYVTELHGRNDRLICTTGANPCGRLPALVYILMQRALLDRIHFVSF